jgi:hypothetical protein
LNVTSVVIVKFGVRGHITILDSDLSTVPGPLFANRLACSNMKELILALCGSHVSKGESSVSTTYHEESFVILVLTSFGKN